MKFLYIFLLLATLLVADDDRYEYEEHYFPLDMKHLKLSKKQHKQVKKIVNNFRYEYQKFHTQESAIHKKVSQLFLEKNFDKKEFIKLNTKLKKHSIQIQASFFSSMHKVLTQKQKRRFSRYMQEWEIE